MIIEPRTPCFCLLAATLACLPGGTRAAPPAPASPTRTTRPSPHPRPRGDGRADDTAALQALLDTQKIVTLPPGRYRITRPLHLASHRALTGMATIIVDFDSNTMDAANAAIYGQGSDIRIEGITIAKRFRDGSYGIGILIASDSATVAIRNVEITGYSARYGIHVVESANLEITGCYIHDFLMDTTADMILDSPAGIRLTRCKNAVVSQNRILRIEVGAKGYASISPVRPAYGKQFYQSDCLTVMQCRNITLSGNVLETSGEGIDLLLSQECTVTGNSIRNIWFQGIKMLGVRHSSVTGNVLSECLQGIGLAEHVAQKTDCSGNTILGNTLVHTGAPGTFRIPREYRTALLTPAPITYDGHCPNNTVTANTITP